HRASTLSLHDALPISHHAWSDRARGAWPDLVPPDERSQYDLATIREWLGVFLYRFFQISQFKRSALPNSPKVGSGGAVSPRGDRSEEHTSELQSPCNL